MPDGAKLLQSIMKKTDKALPAPSIHRDNELRDRMSRIVQHARAESDLVFPEDADIDECFNIVASAFMDALATTNDVVAAYRATFPRLSGRRVRTPAKEGTRLLEVMRDASTTVDRYNREVFARAGVTVVKIAGVLGRIIDDPNAAVKDRLEAIRLIDRFCVLTSPATHVPGSPSVVVPVQVNTGRAGRPKGNTKRQEFIEAEITEQGRQVRDAIFTEGGGGKAKKQIEAAIKDLEGQTKFPWAGQGEDAEVSDT